MPLTSGTRLGSYEVALATPGQTGTAGTLSQLEIHVVLNWFEELKARVPVK